LPDRSWPRQTASPEHDGFAEPPPASADDDGNDGGTPFTAAGLQLPAAADVDEPATR
jgi:hypothetical protein